MNIFQNIAISNLRLRPFYRRRHQQDASDDIIVDVQKWFGADPVFNQYEPFRLGYDTEFSIASKTDLLKWIENDYMFEIFSDENNLQLGDSAGFKITSVTPPASPDVCLYSYTFKSVKPNKEPFKTINDEKK